MTSNWIRLVLGLGIGSGGHAVAGVVVVDPQGQPGTLALQNAIDAASDGDILLIRSGRYDSTTQNPVVKILGKGLTLIRDSQIPVTIPALDVEAVPANSRVVVRGLTVTSATPQAVFAAHPGAECTGCAGMVWFEDCSITGERGKGSTISFVDSTPGIRAWDSKNLVLERCVVTGGNGLAGSQPFGVTLGPGPGVDLLNSKATIHGSDVRGGVFCPYQAASISAGVALTQSRLMASDCNFMGGASNCGFSFCAGIRFFDLLSHAWLRDSSVAVGPSPSMCPNLEPPITDNGNSVTYLPSPAMALEISSPVRTGGVAQLKIQGEPGASVAVLVGGFGTNYFVPAPYQNALLMDFQFAGPILLGSIPSSGSQVMNFLAFPLPAAFADGMTVAMQGFMIAPHSTLEAATAYVQVKAGI